ncbi:MAG TPA: segregation/condensation protein A [Terriglobia bacterium]|nr:segregation/condensation protein A [Terriglobia bacterium]
MKAPELENGSGEGRGNLRPADEMVSAETALEGVRTLPDQSSSPPPAVPGEDYQGVHSESDAKGVSGSNRQPPLLKLKIYEGPLDLLLDLIRKQKINIYDIPIATITGQYLEYLHMLEEMNIDVAGEFIFMAATLIHIKSRTLLPPDPTAPLEEQEDPRTDLVERLLEHEQFKNAAEMLQSKRVVEEATWSQSGVSEFIEAEDEPGLAVSTFDLIAAFQEVIERAKKRPPLRVAREEVTVAEMIEHVKQALLASRHPVQLEDLMACYVARPALIAMVLALLEMVRIHAIILRQRELFGPITIHRNKRFEEIMSGIDVQMLEASFEEKSGNQYPAEDGDRPNEPES